MSNIKSTTEIADIQTDTIYHDPAEISVNRWTKADHDRLYINEVTANKDSYYDIESGELELARKWDGEVETDGEDLIITIWKAGDERSLEITVRIPFYEGVETDEADESVDDDREATPSTPVTAEIEKKCGKCNKRTDDRVWAEDMWMCRECSSSHYVVSDPKDHEDGSEEKKIITDGGQVADNRGYTLDDYPDRPDGEERLIGLNGWGAWTYDPVQGKLRNYKREDAPGRMPLDETHGAEETIGGKELVERIQDLDAITKYGYTLIYESGGTDAAINSLLRAGLSPGQAWAYYGVEILGHSRNAWAAECGYSDHSVVSEAVRKAKSKLP